MTALLGCEVPEGNNHILAPALRPAPNMCLIYISYINERVIWLMNLKGLIYREFVK